MKARAIRLHGTRWSFAALLALFVMGVHAGTDGRTAPLFDDLGTHHMPITTAAPLAQRYYDQGLILAYGFNHAEAARSFREAQRLDPNCAMCFYGEALVLGPNINKPMDPADAAQAVAAVNQAQALAGGASPREQALIAALATRYADPAPADRTTLDQAYADAMATVVARYPDDLDAATFYAESLMDLMPWSYYTEDGAEKPLTKRVVALLEGILARNPDHPGAIHFYIHAVEASQAPGRAEGPADRLGKLVPGSGHLVHMPSHIYLRIGRYHDATVANELASKADESYINQCRVQGFYPALYYPHNIHFMCTRRVSRTQCHGTGSRTQARRQRAGGLDCRYPAHRAVLAVPLFGYIRFARWDDVLAERQPREDHRFATAMWHAARGVAFAAKGDHVAAASARDAYREAAQAYGPDAYEKYGYPADKLLAIAGHLLEAAVAGAAGDDAVLVSAFEQAIVIEDALPYMEPPYWFFPTRQLLGHALLARDRAVDAEAVFRRDLELAPNNGWSLGGLAASLAAQGRGDEATAVRGFRPGLGTGQALRGTYPLFLSPTAEIGAGASRAGAGSIIVPRVSSASGCVRRGPHRPPTPREPMDEDTPDHEKTQITCRARRRCRRVRRARRTVC